LNLHENILSKLFRVIQLPPGILLRKISRILCRRIKSSFQKLKDKKGCSFSSNYPKGALNTYFQAISPDLISNLHEDLIGLSYNYLEHCFDTLGSGWINVRHGIDCRGLEGYRYDMHKGIEPDPNGNWLEGIICPTNLKESQNIWRLIYEIPYKQARIAHHYIPIDWHRDVKSGYRWNESAWYGDITIEPCPGADIKIPWELARMQHLVQLALASCVAENRTKTDGRRENKGYISPEKYIMEFRNQILDFISTNPPRYGVNWKTSMEVAIRASNWLIAYDIFRVNGFKLDQEFKKVFIRSIYEHGLHIINNLEWNEEQRTNHYLANIVGLLFIAAYLPGSAEIDAWMAFAVQEISKEALTQFYPDGGNFEASTSYHRFSAEMLTYAIALLLSLPKDKLGSLRRYKHRMHQVYPKLKRGPLRFYRLPNSDDQYPIPPEIIQRMEKIAEFTIHITRPNGQIVQIGDNDSGRFVKIQPIFRKTTVARAKEKYANLKGYNHLPDQNEYSEEDILDHRSLVAAINGLFGKKEFAQFTGNSFIETELIQKMAGGVRLPLYQRNGAKPPAKHVRIGTGKIMHDLINQVERLNSRRKQVANIKITDGHFFDTLESICYPNFGIYIYRNDQFYLLIRCGPVGQNGFGGHAHNDQLSIELQIDLKDIAVDPGTYLYTPLSDLRNQYRSVSAHYGPKLADNREPGRLDLSLFQLPEQANSECLYFQKDGFAGVHHGYGDPVYRLVSFKDRNITIIDYTTGHLILKSIDLFKNPIDSEARKVPISPGYGLQYN